MYKDNKNVDQSLVSKIFDLDMDMDSKRTMDLFGGVRAFLEYNGANQLYPGSNMKDVKKIAGQEYMVQQHLRQFFIDAGLKPHKAEDDVFALLGLFTEKSELLKAQGVDQTVVDYIAQNLGRINTVDTTLIPNKHILRAKKRGASFSGKGYLNFATDSQGTIYTASNHIIGSKDKVAEAFGGAVHENFNVGFGVNKGGFYELNKIQKIELNDEIRNKIMPISKAYKLEELIETLKEYEKNTNRRITFEYIMLDKVNDSAENAKELANLIKGINCYVNLIPYNETENIDFKRTKQVQILKFYDIFLLLL